MSKGAKGLRRRKKVVCLGQRPEKVRGSGSSFFKHFIGAKIGKKIRFFLFFVPPNTLLHHFENASKNSGLGVYC